METFVQQILEDNALQVVEFMLLQREITFINHKDSYSSLKIINVNEDPTTNMLYINYDYFDYEFYIGKRDQMEIITAFIFTNILHHITNKN